MTKSWKSLGMIPYTAGIIDGEASIGLYPRVQAGHRVSRYLQLKVQMGMTDKRVPLLMQQVWGGSGISKKYYKKEWATCHVWTIQGNMATAMLDSLMPFLIVKRAQASLVIEYWRDRKELTPEEQQTYREAMTVLNKRSPERDEVMVEKVRKLYG